MLAGPAAGREILATHGGVLIEYDGTFHEVAAGDDVAECPNEIAGGDLRLVGRGNELVGAAR